MTKKHSTIWLVIACSFLSTLFSAEPVSIFPRIESTNTISKTDNHITIPLDIKDPISQETLKQLAIDQAYFGLPLLVARIITSAESKEFEHFLPISVFELLYGQKVPALGEDAQKNPFNNLPIKELIDIYAIEFDFNQTENRVVRIGSDLDAMRKNKRVIACIELEKMSDQLKLNELQVVRDASKELLKDNDEYIKAGAEVIYGITTLRTTRSSDPQEIHFNDALMKLSQAANQKTNPYAQARAQYELLYLFTGNELPTTYKKNNRSKIRDLRLSLIDSLRTQEFNMLLHDRAEASYALYQESLRKLKATPSGQVFVIDDTQADEIAKNIFFKLAYGPERSPTKKSLGLLKVGLREQDPTRRLDLLRKALNIPQEQLKTKAQKKLAFEIAEEAKVELTLLERSLAEQQRSSSSSTRKEEIKQQEQELKNIFSQIKEWVGPDFNQFTDPQKGRLKRLFQQLESKKKSVKDIEKTIKEEAEKFKKK